MSWLRVKELTQLTLQLLSTLAEVNTKIEHLCSVCSIATDYLLRVNLKKIDDQSCAREAYSILITAMQRSPNVRLSLVKDGAFVTLCDLGIKTEEQLAFDVARMLLGGDRAVKKWSSSCREVSRLHHKSDGGGKMRPQIQEDMVASNVDTSPSILSMAALTVPDHNLELEVRTTITRKQLYPYHAHGGRCTEELHLLTSDIGESCSLLKE
nr:uncharacterized protein LOC128689519 [Cherax quadricarinatus]